MLIITVPHYCIIHRDDDRSCDKDVEKYAEKINLDTFLDRLDLFLNKYDPQFKYDYNVKDNYTEIVLQTKITKTNKEE